MKHEAETPGHFAKRVVWLNLQELEELLAHLGHDRAHVVPSDGVTVVQVHHSLFQVAGSEGKGQATGGLPQMGAPPGGPEAQRDS